MIWMANKRMIPPLWRRQQQVLITMIIIMHPIARMARRPWMTARRWPETIRMMLHRKRNQPEGAGQRRRDNDEHRLGRGRGRGRYLSFHRANGCRWGHNSVDAVAPAVPPRQLLPRRPPWLLHHPRLCNYRYHPWPCYNLPRCGNNDPQRQRSSTTSAGSTRLLLLRVHHSSCSIIWIQLIRHISYKTRLHYVTSMRHRPWI